MDNKEIKKANHKALPIFVAIMLISLILGGILGIIIFEANGAGSTDKWKAAAAAFGTYIAPWLMLLCALAVAAVCTPLCRKGKKILSAWDGEDEAVCDKAEKMLSYVLWISNCAYILSFFLIAATYSARNIADFGNLKTLVPFFVSLVSFMTILMETLVFQQKSLDAVKKANPEKNVSIFDVKFQKKWLDRCDEAEKLVIGKCAYKAFAATNKVCVALAGLLAVGSLVFEFSFLASFSVCVIWFVNQFVYFRETMKYSKAGSKVS